MPDHRVEAPRGDALFSNDESDIVAPRPGDELVHAVLIARAGEVERLQRLPRAGLELAGYDRFCQLDVLSAGPVIR